MLPCISEVTTLPCSFAEDVAAFAAGGCQTMEVWLTKLEQHLESNSIEDTRGLLKDGPLRLVASAYQGGLLLSQGEERRAHYDHFKRRLDLCWRFNIPVMLIIADFVEQPDQTAFERSVVSLAQAAQWAAGFGVRLGLEFRAKDTFCSSLDTALALVAQCNEPNVGVCLDLFHYYTGPSKLEDLQLLTSQNLTHVQISDLAGVPREMATDCDRVLPGDGGFQLRPIMQRLRTMGYEGPVSLEIMNPILWQIKASQLVEFGMMALNRLIEELD